LAAGALHEVAASLWAGMRAGAWLEEDDPLASALSALARAVLADETLLAALERGAVDVLASVLDRHRREAARLIETTIEGWDPDEASRRIELYVGRDLQFIRVNGMVVGGLVGLVL